ncbi:DoxX family protein [Pseudonocardia xinjiangensis]|uniref:DoxX family protein n=1 Tax=Pseudonocardia xinjiangensis TaxID=75289 RepID=A0ABX1RCU2_9PSEU|nr:DoxX family protein [Pseudonocardia xinjiangensis]NMH78196.1 DoxX family protein [Pseudonocardia xinjiangensis]
MNVVAWILQIVLAVAFLGSGVMKVVRPKPALVSAGMGYAEDFSDGAIKAIGALEIVGAVGLILPWVLDVAPVLTPIAAVGLALVMAGAVVVHIRRKEQFVPALVLGVLSLVLAVLRFAS